MRANRAGLRCLDANMHKATVSADPADRLFSGKDLICLDIRQKSAEALLMLLLDLRHPLKSLRNRTEALLSRGLGKGPIHLRPFLPLSCCGSAQILCRTADATELPEPQLGMRTLICGCQGKQIGDLFKTILSCLVREKGILVTRLGFSGKSIGKICLCPAALQLHKLPPKCFIGAIVRNLPDFNMEIFAPIKSSARANNRGRSKQHYYEHVGGNKMKKLFIPLLVVCLLLFALCACTDSSMNSEDNGNISSNEDGTIDDNNTSDQNKDNNTNDNNTNDNKTDNKTDNNTDSNTDNTTTRSGMSTSRSSAGTAIGEGIGRAVNDVGNAASDIGRGIENAVR